MRVSLFRTLWLPTLCLFALIRVLQSSALAQSPAVPSLEAAGAPAPRSREVELEERLRRIESRYEAMERLHAKQYEALNKRYESLVETLKDRSVIPAAAPAPAQPVPDATNEGGEGARDNVAASDRDAAETPPDPSLPRRNTSREGGAGARDNVSDPSRSRRPSQKPLSTRVEFGPGFQISSDDDEYMLQFHNLTQIDERLYSQAGQDPVHSGFSIPRQRWYFSGRMTKKIEFYTTINRGFGTIDVYDAFINYRYDDRMMFKVGRFKTPFSYEFYAVSAPDFIVPERSLFASNFGPNRQLGFMSWGQLFEKRVDYAVGMFNGNRLSFQDTNEGKDVISYLNARPWGSSKEKDGTFFLKSLNIGGSVDHGNQNNVPLPTVLRTSIAASNAADAVNIAPPWLSFNKNVIERGPRTLWGLHLAYFYKHLSIISEWESGFQTYATGLKGAETTVPIQSYYVSAGYFLTGETVDRRTQIEPLLPFDLRKGHFGPGAIELQGRYSSLQISKTVFASGLADPNLWSNSVSTIDLGVNWYLNAYTKIVFDWEHAMFGQPVLYAPGRLQATSDLFWWRFQVYF